MQPAYENGDILITQKWSAPQKGDVVTAYIEELDCIVVKRVMATEGDHIRFGQDAIYLNDEQVLKTGNTGAGAEDEFTVPARHYFLMGDNLENSADSREFGCVGKSNIQGIVIEKLF